MRLPRPSRFTLVVLVVTALSISPLLAINDHDPTYTCRSSPLVDVIHPEPEESVAFRREVAFDVGHACNRTARAQVAVAGVIILVAAILIGVRRRRVLQDA